MRFITQFLIGFTGIGLVLFLMSLPLPSAVSVSRSVLVSTPKDIVSSSVMDLHEWKHWNPLLQDSNTAYIFEGSQKVHWTAHDGKTNAIEMRLFTADSAYVIISTNGQPAFESGFSVTQNEGSSHFTKVDWWIREELGWLPWEKFYGLFTESLKEEYLDNSLQSLKRHLDNHY